MLTRFNGSVQNVQLVGAGRRSETVKYTSTRGNGQICSGAEAILSGIASDGGLFVPLTLPFLDIHWAEKPKPYIKLAAEVLGKLLPDYSELELEQCAAAYDVNFDSVDIAPLVRVGSRSVLELWHGPTSAFKDMALQILPRLLTLALEKTGETSDILILVATSGDTGKAALEGFRDIPGTAILVFFPSAGVSEVQRRQMITQEGKNVGVVAVEGNFDDAQTGVKAIFADSAIRGMLAQKKWKLSSANSINWGRLAPQIAYYFSAYQALSQNRTIQAGDLVNFCVPTGNFGNILAGYYAKQMGVPIGRLICASNDNNVLTDFLRTGIYDRNRPFHQTISPSMDILISSNLERLLYHTTQGDADQVREWMRQLNSQGRYEIDSETLSEIQRNFWADWALEADAAQIIRQVWEQENYLLDPHTAVAWKAADTYEKN
jgi:threonine synthase